MTRLNGLAEQLESGESQDFCVPLFYLDSFDLEWTCWQSSAIHRLKELTSIHGFLRPETVGARLEFSACHAGWVGLRS